MSIEFDRESPGKFDSRTLNRETLNRWTGPTPKHQTTKLEIRSLSQTVSEM